MAGAPRLLCCLLVVTAAIRVDSAEHTTAATPATPPPLYFGWYMDGKITSHRAGANLYIAKTAAAAVRAKRVESGGMVSLLEIDHLFFRRNPLDPGNRKNLTLDPDWKAHWEGMAPVAQELLRNGTAIGFFLGDELIDKCVRFEWIALMAATVKQSFPQAVAWYNEGVPMVLKPKSCAAPLAPSGGYSVPQDVDWFSVDLYHPLKHIAPQPGWVESQVQPLYAQHVYPLLNFSAGQRVAFVPGSFGSSANEHCNATCYREMVGIDAAAYFRWAENEPERVAAIVPWHWDGCESNQDCVVHRDEVGTAELPAVAAIWRTLAANSSRMQHSATAGESGRQHASDAEHARTSWSGIAAGAQYSVSLLPEHWNSTTARTAPYAIDFATATSSSGGAAADPWLVGQPPAVHCGGRWHRPSDGSLRWEGIKITSGSDGTWGNFSAANVSWTMQPSGVPFYTAIIHHTAHDSLAFEQGYGGRCVGANFTELPSNSSAVLDETAHAALNPSSEFPSFRAPEDGSVRLTSQRMGFFSTGGVMNYKAMSHGTGLRCSAEKPPNGMGSRCNGYSGGARGGPLVLFEVNRSRGGDALVLSTGNHFTSSVIGLRRTCSHASWRQSAPELHKTPHIDYSDNDLGGLYNITEEQCAATCLASPMCNAYTWGQGQIAGEKRCFLKSSTGFTPRTNSPQLSGYFCKDDPADSSLVAGTMGYVLDVPAGTTMRFVLSPLQNEGITAAVHKWGQVMRNAYRLHRTPLGVADPVGHTLGYWTDNGGVYDGRQPLPTQNMSRLFSSLAEAAVPVRYLQLDPYWYKDSWTPQLDLYGTAGLPGLVSAINETKLLLYHNFWTRYTQHYYAAQGKNFTFAPGYRFLNWDRPRSIFQILPEQSFEFFDLIFGTYMDQGVMMGAEVDFLDWMQLTVPALFSTLDGGHRYLKGFADAALKHGVSHQLCMSMPSQVMDSLLLPAVTNARASPDNTPTNENRWLIAYTSLMMWPLDVQPFADNVWSMSHEPAEPYGPGVFRHNVELQMLITTLTAGPVGIADEIGFTNATLVLQTCTANGTLLQPDKPSTPIDAMFSPSAPFRPPGEISQTHTRLTSVGGGGDMVWRYVLAVDTDYPLHQDDLWPADARPRDSLAVSWHTRHHCGEEALSRTGQSKCAERWNASSAYQLQTSPMVALEHGFDLLMSAPIMWSSSGRGISLLGELSKIVAVSSARFGQELALQHDGTLALKLRGAPREQVELTYAGFEHKGAAAVYHRQLVALDDHGLGDASVG